MYTAAQKEYKQKYYQDNKEKIDKKSKEWSKTEKGKKSKLNYYHKNKEKKDAQSKDWRNSEKGKEYYKKYNEEHKDERKIYFKERYNNKREEILSEKKVYHMNNRDKDLERCKKRWHEKTKFDPKEQERRNAGNRRDYHNPESDYRMKKDVRVQTFNKYRELLKTSNCKHCGTTEKLLFHHITYTRDDFIILCNKCHKKLHYKMRAIETKV